MEKAVRSQSSQSCRTNHSSVGDGSPLFCRRESKADLTGFSIDALQAAARAVAAGSTIAFV
jgi:hypothetical protein